ncbi:NAD(P)-dependent oxidoreductase [Pseudomonas stutzeri]|uniref:NAD(P)-dependent oxidoreductase n=1 Tax=Stutzerimonas stutzeri TaxID=316 RepID=UPI000C9B8FB8|nr:NAD(P)-dependent oxidoreductase [Stutzerimonas stutzeri]MCQ4280908.1 NAD(P)-dependent oxidoreductase [Stutzerimonas stutzeri]PNF74497.1 pyridine nucleotide transhydrogenase [Stutzerimonas stutzeri]
MNNALIGFTGFVGGTLLKQTQFESLYRSTNICDIDGQSFSTVVCAGAPAQKWIANRDPEADQRKIDELIAHLATIKCQTFVLISTVDVFKTALDVDEDTPVDETDLHAYGLNRRRLEKFVEGHFSEYLIVRLPGLVGPGLRKNVIFDFLNNNNLHAIDSRGVFQFYPMVNLWFDIETALKANLKLIHLTAEPISVADISALGFGKAFDNSLANTAATYDMRTKHAALFGASSAYQYSARETVLAVRSYAQSDTPTVKAAAGAKA